VCCSVLQCVAVCCSVLQCVIWMHRVTQMNELWHTDKWAMSHVWTRHVTHLNASCHTSKCVMSYIWMRHVTHQNASCHISECVMSHIWMRHATNLNASRHMHEWEWPCLAYEWVTSHIRMSVTYHITHHTTHTNERHISICVPSHTWTSHATRMNPSCHTEACVIYMNASRHTCIWIRQQT